MMLSVNRIVVAEWCEKDLEERGSGLTKVSTVVLDGGTEENHEQF